MVHASAVQWPGDQAEGEPMKILIADDHALIRDGLRELIAKQDGMVLVGEAENGLRAVRLAAQLQPDVVLMDIEMPDMNGVEATRQIRKDSPGVRVIALSMHAARAFIQQVLRAGASGYVLKESAFKDVVTAVRTVSEGRYYISPRITDVVLLDYIRHLDESPSPPASPLSDREREVLQLLTEGSSSREIAGKLFVSIATIDSHRKHIMEKLRIHSVAELTKYAIREGITSLE